MSIPPDEAEGPRAMITGRRKHSPANYLPFSAICAAVSLIGACPLVATVRYWQEAGSLGFNIYLRGALKAPARAAIWGPLGFFS